MAGLIQSDEGLMMIGSVVWAQYINVTGRQTDRQPHHSSNSRPNAVYASSCENVNIRIDDRVC